MVVFLVCFFVLCSCHKQIEEPPLEKPPFEQENFFLVNYRLELGKGGTFIGETVQRIKEGQSTTPVTLVPDLGYKFLSWKLSTNPAEIVDTEVLTRVEENVHSDMICIAVFEGPLTCGIKFEASEGGIVEGNLKQKVLYGGKGETVTAIPNKGYRFIGWSDGETEEVRTNDHVTTGALNNSFNDHYKIIMAKFERYQRFFEYEYNEATEGNTEKETTITIDKMSESKLVVPKREGYEFLGWYSDWFHTIQVTDAEGNVIVGEEWFNNDLIFWNITNPDMKLFAKWKPTKQVPKYKILMIYVTEIEADLESTNGEIIPVHYKMTQNEKKMCEMLSSYLEEYLEAMLNSTVDFEVDSYYTKDVLRTEQFYRGTTTLPGGNKLFYDYGIDPKQNMIPEVYEILDNYDSVITSFSMNDYDLKLHITGGSGEKKYANIHLEFMFRYFYDDCPSECIFDFEYPGVYRCWISFMETYTHKFIHTVEMQLRDADNYGLHNIAKYYSDYVGPINIEFDFQIDYLNGRFDIGEKLVGIPYEFWTGEYFNEQ